MNEAMRDSHVLRPVRCKCSLCGRKKDNRKSKLLMSPWTNRYEYFCSRCIKKHRSLFNRGGTHSPEDTKVKVSKNTGFRKNL